MEVSSILIPHLAQSINDSKRRDIKNLQYKIENLEKNNQLLEASIPTLKLARFDLEYIAKTIQKTKDNIEKNADMIITITIQIKNISDGSMDTHYEDELKKATDDKLKLIKTKQEKVIKKAVDKTAQYKKQQSDFHKIRRQTASEHEMNKSLQYFYSVCDSLNDTTKNNLRTMPNNKGYIFRGVWFCGNKPDDKSGQTVMFETKSGERFVHSYDHRQMVYRKTNRNQNTLIEERTIRDKNRKWKKDGRLEENKWTSLRLLKRMMWKRWSQC